MSGGDATRGTLRIGSGFGTQGRGLIVSFDARESVPQRSEGGAVVPLAGGQRGTIDEPTLEIRIVAGRTASKYSWERVHPNYDAANGYSGDVSGGGVSGGTHDGFFALEVNGRTGVAVGSIAFARFSPVGPWLLFVDPQSRPTSGPSAGGNFNTVTIRNVLFYIGTECHVGDIALTGQDLSAAITDRGAVS